MSRCLRLDRIVTLFATAAMVAASFSTASCQPPTARATTDNGPRPFYAFCYDIHDTQKRDLAQQAVMLKQVGFDGQGTSAWRTSHSVWKHWTTKDGNCTWWVRRST